MLNRIQKGTNVYAEFPLAENAEIDRNSMMMINVNRQKNHCFAGIQVEENNGVNEKLLFDVTSMITMQEYLREYLSQEEFKQMISHLIDGIESFDEYMIDVRQVGLQLDNVYINRLNHRVSFLCFAVKNLEQSGDIYTFFHDLVTQCRVNVTVHETSYWHCVLNIVQDPSGFSLQNMRDAMASLTSQASVQPAPIASPAEPKHETTSGSLGAAMPQPKPVPPMAPTVPPMPMRNDAATVTVARPAPVMPAPVPFEQSAEADEKKGLFGGLFGGKGNKNTKPAKQQKQKKKKNNSPAPAGSMGLAGRLNNAAEKSKMNDAGIRSDFSDMETDAGIPPMTIVPPVQPAPAVPFSGTTVLRGSNINQGIVDIPQPPVNPAPVMPQPPVDPAPVMPLPNVQPQPVNPVPVMPLPNVQPQPTAPSGTMHFGGDSSIQLPPLPQNVSADTTVLKPAESAETTVLRNNDSPETTILRPKTAYLVCMRNQEKFTISKSVFRIGRDRADIDLSVKWNTNVGHQQAEIMERNGEYYLIDLNSRNHSYLNQVMLQPQTETVLRHQDIIELADEKFQFFEQ